MVISKRSTTCNGVTKYCWQITNLQTASHSKKCYIWMLRACIGYSKKKTFFCVAYWNCRFDGSLTLFDTSSIVRTNSVCSWTALCIFYVGNTTSDITTKLRIRTNGQTDDNSTMLRMWNKHFSSAATSGFCWLFIYTKTCNICSSMNEF